jgi:hypothetical protein
MLSVMILWREQSDSIRCEKNAAQSREGLQVGSDFSRDPCKDA